MQNSYSSQISFESQETPEKQEDKDRQTKMENQESLVYAGFWVRFAAYALDSLIVFAGLLIVRMIFVGISLAGGGAVTGMDILFHYSLKDIVLYGLKVLYFIAFTYLTGTTLGKKAMNLRVVSKNPEEKLTLFNVVYRETVGRFLCSLPVNIGYIVAGIDSEKRGFHDLLCDTRVVYQKKIKAWMAQPGTVVPECEKPNVEEQKPQTSEGELSKTQENVQMKESGIRELKKTENTQSSVVEKLGKPVYNGYRLVENKSEKEIASNATVNENISEKDT